METATVHRRGKAIRERILATIILAIASPVFLLCAIAIKLEGIFRPSARGPLFLHEERVCQGRKFQLIKFRTLDRNAVGELSTEAHIATHERRGRWTKVGWHLHQWYLDELPQFWNIVRGDMYLIGTRPWPVPMYEREMRAGRTWKKDLPAGLVGPVQSTKGHRTKKSIEYDEEYLHAYRTWPGWKLLLLDLRILLKAGKVQLEHKGL